MNGDMAMQTSAAVSYLLLQILSKRLRFLNPNQKMSTSPENILNERAAEIEAIYALATTLQCKLDRRTIAVLVELLEQGVHPEALADVINEIRLSSELSTSNDVLSTPGKAETKS